MMAIGLLSGLALYQIQHAQDEAFAGTTDEYIETKAARKKLDFGLTAAATGSEYVPRTYLETLPRGLLQIRNVREKKELFSATLLPLILLSNEKVIEDRSRLTSIKHYLADNASLSESDTIWLRAQRRKYSISKKIPISTELIDRILYHCDIIPASLALAQAAIESGWGTSRFAQTGNAIFGQWVWGENADGMLPLNRNEGATHKVKKFERLLDSVQSYIHNINRNSAYKAVRDLRAELRTKGKPITGTHLAQGLIQYSQRGEDYIKDILNLISYNQFSGLDFSQLEPVGANQIKI
jgi:Bax protein